MASKNGGGGRIGRAGPSFLQIALVVVIIVLLYSYWSVSSRNSLLLRDQMFLQQRLRSLAGKKISTEKRSASLLSQLTELSKQKQMFESTALRAKQQSTALQNKIKETEDTVRQEQSKLAGFQRDGVKYKSEVAQLRQSINGTATKLYQMHTKAKQLLEKYKTLKSKYGTLLKDSEETVKQRDLCQYKLAKLSKKDRTASKPPKRQVIPSEGNKEEGAHSSRIVLLPKVTSKPAAVTDKPEEQGTSKPAIKDQVDSTQVTQSDANASNTAGVMASKAVQLNDTKSSGAVSSNATADENKNLEEQHKDGNQTTDESDQDETRKIEMPTAVDKSRGADKSAGQKTEAEKSADQDKPMQVEKSDENEEPTEADKSAGQDTEVEKAAGQDKPTEAEKSDENEEPTEADKSAHHVKAESNDGDETDDNQHINEDDTPKFDINKLSHKKSQERVRPLQRQGA